MKIHYLMYRSPHRVLRGLFFNLFINLVNSFSLKVVLSEATL